MSPSFVDHLRRQADSLAQACAFTFLDEVGVEQGVLSFGALDRQARAVAATLQSHCAEGDRAVLVYPAGLDFIVAFLGCLYAGVIAVPVNPPRRQQGLEKLIGIALNSGARRVLADPASAASLALRLAEVPELKALPVSAIGVDACDASEGEWRAPSLHAESIAFLQYTSGSTGQPKGVAITHANLLANERMIADGFASGLDTVGLGWLPFHHDMGLVGNILNPLYVGFSCVLMSPEAFAQQPVRWLQAITKYGATTTGGPNFAYELCVRRVTPDKMDGLDLSSWRLAFCGAEPVHKATLDRFAEKFAPVGFDRKAFYSCYGMAEATLFVSGGICGQGAAVKEVSAAALENHHVVPADASAPALALVGCGTGRGDGRILIVDPVTRRPCEDACVGEIWISGPNVAQGYWNNSAASEESFGACLADSGAGPFLRTGDLGFVCGGELFVTGRLKELIIINGRNLYPHDVEEKVALSHPVLDGCGGAAFSVHLDGNEKLIVVHAVLERHLSAADMHEIKVKAREAVASHFDVQLHDLVLVRPGAVPRTSSGKTQRNLCRDLYRQRKLPVLEMGGAT